jgi:hypothetical protein
VDAGQLDHDLVCALLADLGLGHTQLVDAAPHDCDRPVEVLRGQLVALGRLRLQHDLEAAAQVEAEHRLLGHDQRHRPAEGGEDQRDKDQMLAASVHGSGAKG